ncbi:MAG: hypothetical protein V1899_06880 [Planctomycetota bacterium]
MLTRKISLILSVIVALSAWAEEAKPAQKIELRFYDVSMLTYDIQDYPGPNISLQNVNSSLLQADIPTLGVKLTLTNVADMIRTRIRPETWDPKMGTSIEERGGLLMVMQTSKVHALIAQLLTNFHAFFKPQIVVSGLLIAASELPKETYLDATALAKALGPQGAAGALASPRIICYNTQRVHVISGKEFNYIRDMDIDGLVYNPLVVTGLEGYVFDVRPTLSADRKVIQLDLQFTLNLNVNLNETRSLTLASPIVMAGGGKDAVRFPIETPSLDVRSVRTQVAIPIGKWVLAGTMLNTNDAKDRFLLLFVNAKIAMPAQAEAK